jgi:hypothetical protein
MEHRAAASAKSTSDTRRDQLLQVSVDIILLDRALESLLRVSSAPLRAALAQLGQ